jgi:protein-disulfide isomerase
MMKVLSALVHTAALVGLAACASTAREPAQAPPPAKAGSPAKAESPAKPSSSAVAQTDSRVAATVDGEAVTMGELDSWIKEDLFNREMKSASKSKRYQIRSDAIERVIDERVLELEAKKRGLAPGDLLDAELKALGPVTDEEVMAFYKENKDRIQGDGDLEELMPRIRSFLERMRPGEVMADFRKDATVKIELERPRSTVTGTGASRGPADARVVIVEFSDYQCPFCRRAEPTLKELVERYPNDVRWEYRHYPLPNHPQARPAAEAAVCAEAQGKFWEYHEKLFGQEGSMDSPGLLQYAREVGLDMARFEACQQAPATRERVAADQRAAADAGASGTPSFFVNGIYLNGARPVDEFDELIQAELAAATTEN